MNHRWENNICTKCGIKRERKTRKLHMAMVYHPPYDIYKYDTLFEYTLKNGATTWNRPKCQNPQQ